MILPTSDHSHSASDNLVLVHPPPLAPTHTHPFSLLLQGDRRGKRSPWAEALPARAIVLVSDPPALWFEGTKSETTDSTPPGSMNG